MDKLCECITRAIDEGKSVTGENKRMIKSAAREIRKVIKILPHPSTTTATSEIQPQTIPETATSMDALKKEIQSCIREEIAKITPTSPTAAPQPEINVTEIQDTLNDMKKMIQALNERTEKYLPKTETCPNKTEAGESSCCQKIVCGTDDKLSEDLEKIGKEVKTVKTILETSNEQAEKHYTKTEETLSELEAKVTESMKQIHNTDTQITQNMQNIEKEITIVKNTIEFPPLKQQQNQNQTNDTPVQPPQYINRKPTYSKIVTTPRFPIMIESTDKQDSSEEIVQKIKTSVDVSSLGVAINGMRKTKGQKVYISCETENDQKIMQKAINEKNECLIATEAPMRNPLIRLTGVMNDTEDCKLIESLINQNINVKNIPEQQKYIKVNRRIKGRRPETRNVIIETSPAVYNSIVGTKIRIGYQTIMATDQSPIVQCYKCLGFGHKAPKCEKSTHCGYCSEEHSTLTCSRTNAPCCINCKENHPAYSSSCPQWAKFDRLARTTISYC